MLDTAVTTVIVFIVVGVAVFAVMSAWSMATMVDQRKKDRTQSHDKYK